jgi:putative serine protease PepD
MRRPDWLTPALGAALVVGLLGGVLGGWLITSARSGVAGSCDSTRVAHDVLPSVVTIAAQGTSGSGTGSGAIATSDGVVVTNDHVIAVAAQGGRIDVRLSDGTTKSATLVGRDPKTDLAVLRIDGSKLPALSLGDADALVVGQPVVALGAPLGLSDTVTSGIVSALGRDVAAPTGDGGTTVLVGSIQTDASINPGNSGGPLVTCAGRLIGINTAISTVPNASGEAGGGSVGIGFAVPAQTVDSITRQLLANGRAAHPWLGMATAPVPQAVADYINTPTGLFVQSVAASGPAATAGIRVGDILTSLDGQAADPSTMARLVVTRAVGDRVPVDYYRGGTTASTTLTLTEQP